MKALTFYFFLTSLAIFTSCKKQTASTVIQPSAENSIELAPWPFKGSTEITYNVLLSIPAKNITNQPMLRVKNVSRDATHPDVVTVETKENGVLISVDQYRYENQMVLWTSFEDKVHHQAAVNFKTPVPIFSNKFKAGDQWGKADTFSLSVVDWVDVPLSKKSVKACKINVELTGAKNSFKRQLWYNAELGTVFESCKYYQDDSITRQETVTLMTISGGDVPH